MAWRQMSCHHHPRPRACLNIMKTSEIIFFIGFGAVATFITTMKFRDWLKKKRTVSSLATRVQHPDELFGLAFFSDAKSAEIAVRVRRVLANNLKMPLDGLAPRDRLDDDLNAELPANPHLFWELETEFGIKTDVENLDSHEKTLARLVTFQDLVEYIERCIAEPQTQKPGADEEKKSSHTYDLAIRSIPILCVGGFLTAVAGIVMQKKSFMNLGGLIFLSGIAVWGFANGGEMLRNLIQSARDPNRKETAHPLSLTLVTCLALFFLWIGGTLLWGILKNALASK